MWSKFHLIKKKTHPHDHWAFIPLFPGKIKRLLAKIKRNTCMRGTELRLCVHWDRMLDGAQRTGKKPLERESTLCCRMRRQSRYSAALYTPTRSYTRSTATLITRIEPSVGDERFSVDCSSGCKAFTFSAERERDFFPPVSVFS